MAETTNLEIPITTWSGTTYVAVTTGSYDLRLSPYSSTGVAGTHVGDGVWSFAGLVGDGKYKLYNTGTGNPVAWGGAGRYVYDGDVGAAQVEAGTLAGQFTFDTPPHLPASVSGADAVRYDEVVLRANQSALSGTKGWTGLHVFSGGIKINTSATVATDGVNKETMDLAISSALNSQPGTYQAPSKVRFVSKNYANNITNRDYTTIAAAVSNILTVATPSATDRYTVFVLSSGYHLLTHASMVDYIDIVCLSPRCQLVIGASGESTTETSTMTIENADVYFGNNNLTGARIYNNQSWEKCNMYGYNAVTFGGTGRIADSNYYSSSSNIPVVSGTKELADADFTQPITFTTYTGILKRGVTDGSNTGISMPTDISLAP